MAASHLIERGFRNLAYCGDPSFKWSVLRQTRFEQVALAQGCRVASHASIPQNDPAYSWDREEKALMKWLKSLPRPIGVMACYDIKAQQLLDACRELSIAVPEEVAVLGVDNDRLLCELASPPLSSVMCNTHRTGYEAASLLERLMSGEKIGAVSTLVKPIGIQIRQSTDTLAIDDPDVASALRFIREHAVLGINVNDVLREVPVSRRVLESRFVRAIGRTPHEEIVRLRIDRVKNLLSETDLSLAEIATRAGFRHDEYMSVAFKKATGMPPSRYRKTIVG
jgi:LacI family transcriptional regulator